MSEIEYLDPEIANEGTHADAPIPNATWMNQPDESGEEYQPDMDPPHINDYAAFKKHKHYRKYFRPWKYVPFPAWLYHPTEEPRLINAIYQPNGALNVEACQAEVAKLGPGWRREPYVKVIDMTGKSIPAKSDTQRLTETLVAQFSKNQGQSIDAASIAAIVAAAITAVQKPGTVADVTPTAPIETAPAEDHGDIERKAMIELAERDGVKIDKRWSNDRIREALGIAVAEKG